MNRLVIPTTIVLITAGTAIAQDVPTVPAAPAAAVAAPARGGLFSRLFKTPEQRVLCRLRFAESPAGQLVNNLLKPVSALTGGIVGPVGRKEAANPENLKKPADTAQGAAAKIKVDEAQAKAKIADLEYLGKRDCKRYPEAEAAILAALRAEKNECVRWAAAKALLSGCCCTPKVIKTLLVVVNGSDKDGNVAEDSERVRMTAFLALERCMRVCQPGKPEEPPEKPAEKGKDADVAQVKFEEMTDAAVFAEARAVLARGLTVAPTAVQRLTAPNNLRDIVFGTVSSAPPAPPPAATASSPSPSPPSPRDRSLTGILKGAAGR